MNAMTPQEFYQHREHMQSVRDLMALRRYYDQVIDRITDEILGRGAPGNVAGEGFYFQETTPGQLSA
jgi:hypothetical protein